MRRILGKWWRMCDGRFLSWMIRHGRSASATTTFGGRADAWRCGMLTGIACAVAAMLLVGCASSDHGHVSSASALAAAGGNGKNRRNVEGSSGKRVGQIRKGVADCLANLPTPVPSPPSHRVSRLVMSSGW